MNDITIVTAFFDIGREHFIDIPRSNNKYLTYFKRWARMQNDLIFYCEDTNFGQEVLNIRKSYGLEDRTKIVTIEKIENIYPDLLKRMSLIQEKPEFVKFREQINATENNAMYDYVMLLKSYCIAEACKISKTRYVAWLDFGWEHGGKAYSDENDYDFEWAYDFGNKINIFYIPPLDTQPIFQLCKRMKPDCLMGAPIVVPKELGGKFSEIIKEAMESLVDVDLIDDDQLLHMMISRKYPELVDLKESYWFLPIHDYGGNHMKLKARDPKPTFFKRVILKLKRIMHIK